MPPLDWMPSVCPHDCPSACALEVEVLDGHRIGRVRGSRRNNYTAGVICQKVSRYAERQNNPGRLLTPLQRVGDRGTGLSAYREISWEAALDEIANNLIKAADRYGSETVWPYYYAGTMGYVQRDGIHRLRHAMRYSRQLNTLCTSLPDSGWTAGVGQKRGVDAREMAEADLIVIWGMNPVHTQVNVMTHVTRARKNRGAQLVVIDPYKTATADVADIHLAPRPGTDGALAVAVMHVLFKEGYADRAYMARYADDAAALEAHVENRDPAWASAITGIPVDDIVGFARLYGETRRSYIRAGYGFARSRNGAVQMHAVVSLPTVTGAWQHRGGGALYSQAGGFGLSRDFIMGEDLKDLSTRVIDMSRIGAALMGEARDLAGGPPITAIFTQNTNPMVVAPESVKVHQGFARPDLFVAVHEQFMTETASMADILIPATTVMEHDDVYVAGGHTMIQTARRIVDPPGETRENHWVISELAERLGCADRHPGFRMTAWEIVDRALKDSGMPGADAVHAKGGHDIVRAFETEHFLDGFDHPDGKFHFKADWSKIGPNHAGMPVLPDHWQITDQADGDHPFRLITAPSRSFLNSSFNETPSSNEREARPTALMAPEDMAELGLEEGGRVRLGNARASVVVHAAAVEGQQRAVVVVEGLWRNAAFEEGLGINALTSADPGPPLGGAVFHDTKVWVRAEAGQAALAAD